MLLEKVLYLQLLTRIPVLEDIGEVEAGGAHFGSGVAGEPGGEVAAAEGGDVFCFFGPEYILYISNIL